MLLRLAALSLLASGCAAGGADDPGAPARAASTSAGLRTRIEDPAAPVRALAVPPPPAAMTTVDAPALPPLDRRAPAHLETATFALG